MRLSLAHGPDHGLALGDTIAARVAQRAAERVEHAIEHAPSPRDLQDHVDDFVAAAGVAGASVAIVEGDGSVRAAASGFADVSAGTKLEVTDRMRAGSISKTATAAAVLDLVARGKISLDDTLARWHPEFEGATGITVRMLLDHTSGIADYLNEPSSKILQLPHTTVLDPSQAITEANRLERIGTPGERHSYSNSNYQLLRSIHDQVAARPLADVTVDTVARLGMTACDVEADRGTDPSPAAPPIMATGHYRLSDSPKQLPATELWRARSLLRSALAGGDGQLVTTASGLARWGHELLASGGRVLPDAARAALLRSADEAPEIDHVKYGHGVFRAEHLRHLDDGTQNRVYGHNGAVAGYRSLMLHSTDTARTVAIQVNDQGFDENELWLLAQDLLSRIAPTGASHTATPTSR